MPVSEPPEAAFMRSRIETRNVRPGAGENSCLQFCGVASRIPAASKLAVAFQALQSVWIVGITPDGLRSFQVFCEPVPEFKAFSIAI